MANFLQSMFSSAATSIDKINTSDIVMKLMEERKKKQLEKEEAGATEIAIRTKAKAAGWDDNTTNSFVASFGGKDLGKLKIAGETLDTVIEAQEKKRQEDLKLEEEKKTVSDLKSVYQPMAKNKDAISKLATLDTKEGIGALAKSEGWDSSESNKSIISMEDQQKAIEKHGGKISDYEVAIRESTGESYWKPRPVAESDEARENREYLKTERRDKETEKQVQAMGNDLDYTKNVRSAYGITAIGYHRAERLEALANMYKDPDVKKNLNLYPGEMDELAIGLNAILQGSNQSAQAQVEGLIPKSIGRDLAKFKQWFTNEPYGTNQQKFVERMLKDIVREKDVMQKQLVRDAASKMAKHNKLRERDSAAWEAQARSWGIDPEIYDEYVRSGYKWPSPSGNDSSGESEIDSGFSGLSDEELDARIAELEKKAKK